MLKYLHFQTKELRKSPPRYSPKSFSSPPPPPTVSHHESSPDPKRIKIESQDDLATDSTETSPIGKVEPEDLMEEIIEVEDFESKPSNGDLSGEKMLNGHSVLTSSADSDDAQCAFYTSLLQSQESSLSMLT